MVIRDVDGTVIIVAFHQMMFYRDVAQAEATTINLGIQMAKYAKLLPLIMETNCQDVVDFVLHKKSIRNDFFWITTEIQNKMQRVNNIVRYCNAIARALAKIALSSEDNCV